MSAPLTRSPTLEALLWLLTGAGVAWHFSRSNQTASTPSPTDARNSDHGYYTILLTARELKAIRYLASRYRSAWILRDSLDPVEESDDMALVLDFEFGEGPYEFDIWPENVRDVYEATKEDGGDAGKIPNLASPTIDALLAKVAAL